MKRQCERTVNSGRADRGSTRPGCVPGAIVGYSVIVSEEHVIATPVLSGSELFINRELAWLDFNERVLAQALDERAPLLERLKFIAIVSSNLDEFYMVRVAGLRRQLAAGVVSSGPDNLTPRAQLAAIEEHVGRLVRTQVRCLEEDLLPRLAAHGVRIVDVPDVPADMWPLLDERFEREIFPVLTPLAVDPAHPFPYISNLSLSLAVELRDPVMGADRFARVKVPKSLPRWISIDEAGAVLPVERLIAARLEALFPGMRILGAHPFRVTRYTDIELSNLEEPEDLLAMIEAELFRRRFGEVVRLEVARGMPEHLRRLLLEELREEDRGERTPLTDPAVVETGDLLDLGDLMQLAGRDIPELRDAPLVPIVPAPLRDRTRSIFEVIREGDLLVHHPFDSFTETVERFFETAAVDPDVLAVKTTLYRTGGDSAIVRALTQAAQRGKQVAVIVELQARFDEENNIGWARMLESYGVHVSYGMPSLKTHAKIAMVVRREPDGIRRYVHVGTGNYNSRTARIYTDFGLFSCKPALGADVNDLFNSLTGFSGKRAYRRLLVAPTGMREQFIALIDREALNAAAGKPARIIAKVNALVDEDVAKALYSASRSGVDIDLIVRGICCLRPGLPVLSERIRVTSIVGRFLEHSRMFYFANGGNDEIYIGSADWMPRNLDRRVEAIVPIDDRALHAHLWSLIQVWLGDDRQAWTLRSDGSWARRSENPASPGTHQALLDAPWGIMER